MTTVTGMTKIRRFVGNLFVVFAICGPAIAVCERTSQSVQGHFNAEDTGVKRPIAIPNDVLDALREDEGVRLVLDDQRIPAARLPSSWFSASAIHLSTAAESDLIVKGEGSILGANVTTFWVFRASPRGNQLVLVATAHDLTVQNTHRNGYLEIETTSATASEVTTVSYRFKGTRYVAYRKRAEHIN
jgi:hypothetical protein